MRSTRRHPPRESMRKERTRFWKKRGRTRTPSMFNSHSTSFSNRRENSNVLTKFDEFRQTEQFCDGVVISAEGKRYKIHRVFLASNSDYFRAAFGSPLSANESVVKLEFPSTIVDHILDFCYRGLCPLTDSNVQQLLPAADQIGIIRLVEQCAQFLQDNMSLFNAYGFFRFAKIYGCEELATSAWEMILGEFVEFMNSSNEFFEMDVDDLESVLCNNNLNVPSETSVFTAVSKWVNSNPGEREGHANRLWNSVRFGLISPEFYRTRVLNSPFIQNVSSRNLWNALDSMSGMQEPGDCTSTPRIPSQTVFAIGGWSTGTPTNCMETYDIRADRWFNSVLCDSVPRAYHGVVCMNNLVYLIGGFDGTNHFNSVRCFDPTNKMWSTKSCMHQQRCYVSCVVVGEVIYAIGGFNSTTRMKSVERYSIVENQWYMVPPMRRRRSDSGAVAVGNKIYVAGGFNGQEVLDSAEYYDTETETWALLPNLNTRRSGLCLVYYNDYIYAIGGFNGGVRLNTIERLSIIQPTEWLPDVPSMITQRSNFACTVLEGKIYVMGGFNGISTIHACECFDGEKWSKIGNMNKTRSALSVCVCDRLQNAADYSSMGLASQVGRSKGVQVQHDN